MTTGLSGCAAAAEAARSMSVMIMVGLAGVSKYTMHRLRAEAMAASMAAPSPDGTGIPATPRGPRNRWISPVVPP
jgi:hypothetical protein